MNIGDSAIPFNLPNIDGSMVSLEQYADKAGVAVIFSCNHCPYVQAWENRMVAIQADYAERGIQFVAINANDAEKYPADNMEAMQQRAADKAFNFPYLRDDSQEIARAYDAERTPEAFLFDEDRKLVYHGAIDDNYENPDAVEDHYLRAALDAMLGGEQPGTQMTPPVGCTIKWR
ncbi:MAG: thioredoxin family protein [Anaerolineae bacterium]